MKGFKRFALYGIITAKPILITVLAITLPSQNKAAQERNVKVVTESKKYLFLDRGTKIMLKVQANLDYIISDAKKHKLLTHPSIKLNLTQTAKLFDSCIKDLEQLKEKSVNWRHKSLQFSSKLNDLIEVQKLVGQQVQAHIFVKEHQI